MAALPELWHICVFIEAGGMELGKLGGGCGGKCVCMVVCVRGSVRLGWGGGVIARPSCSVCVCVCVGGVLAGVWAEGGRAKRHEGRRERGKLQIRLYLQISCQKEPFKGNAPVPAL